MDESDAEPAPSEPAAEPVAEPEPVAEVDTPRRLLDPDARLWLGLVCAVLCIVSALLTYQGITRVERLGYASPDDAMVLQSIWNSTQGEPPLVATLEQMEPPWDRNLLGIHFDLTLVLVVPFCWLFPGYEGLLVLHPLLGLLGVIPLFLYARRRLGSSRHAAAVACLFLVFPILLTNTIRLGGYSWLVPTFVLFAIERLDAGRPRWAALGFILAALNREEVPLLIAAFLLPLAVVDKERRRFLLLVAGGCLAWTVIYMGVLAPWVTPGASHLGRYAHLGGSVPEILISPLARPRAFFSHLLSGESLLLGLLLLLPLLPAPLLAPRHLLAVSVPWAIVAISGRPSDRVLGHYLIPAVPFLFAGLVVGLERLRTWERIPQAARRNAPLIALGTAWLFTGLAWTSDAGPLRRYESVRVLSLKHLQVLQAITPEHRQLCSVLEEIPDGAMVSASAPTLILLTKRRWLHPFPVRADEAEFLVIDTDPRSPRWPDFGPQVHVEKVERALSEQGARVVRVGRFAIVDRRAVARGD